MNSLSPVSASSASAIPVPTRAIAFLSLAAFASAATLRITDPLLPQLAAQFSVSAGAASVVVTSFSISYGLLQAFYGPVGDRFGKYEVVALAVLASALTTSACSFMQSLAGLTLARLISGATAAAIIPLSMAWIGDVVAYKDRQPVLARFLSGQIMGLVFGQAAGGFLGEHLGWRMVFLVVASLYVLAAVALLSELRTNKLASAYTGAKPADPPGFARSIRNLAGLLRRPWVRKVLICVFLEGMAMFGPFAFVGNDLHQRFALGFGALGAVLASYGAGGLIYALSARGFLARLGEHGLAMGGGGILCISFIGLALAPSAWAAIPAIVLSGLGFYMFHNTLQTNATQMAPDSRGAAVALFASCFFVGQSVGVALVAPTIDRYGGRPAFLAAAFILPLLGIWFGGCIMEKQRQAKAS